jgi:YggT family protein
MAIQNNKPSKNGKSEPMTNYKEVRTTRREEGKGQREATFKVTQVLWLLLGLLEGLIGLRIIFKMIGVNVANTIASLLYSVTDFFLAPFSNLLQNPSAGNMVFEVTSLIAMIIYLLIGWALIRIIYVAFYRPRGPVHVKQTVVAGHKPQGENVSQTVSRSADGTVRKTTVTEETEDDLPTSE